MAAPTRRRSWLFTPATKPDRFDRAAEAGADALIVDLEDAVAPADKAAARQTALGWMRRPVTGASSGCCASTRRPPPSGWRIWWRWSARPRSRT